MKRNIFSEKSTYVGLIGAIVTLAGWNFAPDQIDTIAGAVAIIASAALVMVREKSSKDADNN